MSFIVDERLLPDGFALFSYARGPVQVPERAPVVVLHNAVLFPDSLTLLTVTTPATARVLKAVGDERFGAVVLVTAKERTWSVVEKHTATMDLVEFRRDVRGPPSETEVVEWVHACLRKGRLMEARVAGEQGLRDHPLSPELRFVFARLLAAQGEGKEALFEFAQARALAREQGRALKPFADSSPSDDASWTWEESELPEVGCLGRIRAVRHDEAQRFQALVEVGPRVTVRDLDTATDLTLASLSAFPESALVKPIGVAEDQTLKDAARATLRLDLDSATLADAFLSQVVSPVVLAGLCVPYVGLTVQGQQHLLDVDGPERVARVLGFLKVESRAG